MYFCKVHDYILAQLRNVVKLVSYFKEFNLIFKDLFRCDAHAWLFGTSIGDKKVLRKLLKTGLLLAHRLFM